LGVFKIIITEEIGIKILVIVFIVIGIVALIMKHQIVKIFVGWNYKLSVYSIIGIVLVFAALIIMQLYNVFNYWILGVILTSVCFLAVDQTRLIKNWLK
jgi:hypothetical protein